MRSVIFLIGAATMAQTTLITIQDTDQVSASRLTINANFAALLAKHWQGFGSPIGSVPCSVSQNRAAIYTRLDADAPNASAFVCANTGSGTYAWELIAGGGGGGSGNMIGSNNLSEITSASVARANLGLGTAATFASTSFEAAIAAGTTSQYLRGDKTWQTLSTTNVAEGANLYHTSARVWAAMGGTTSGSVPIGNGTSYTLAAIPNCNTSQKTNYRSGAFVCDADLDSGGSGGVGTSTNGQVLSNGSGSVVGLDTIGSGAVARVQSPVMSDVVLSGVSTAPTAALGTATTQIASTAFVAAMGALKADLASPTFTGSPRTPTATPGTNSTIIASTAYADAIAALKANIASPALTGDPTAPTPATADNDTSIATTAHVKAAIDDKTLAFVSGDALKIGRVNAAGNSTEWEYPASRVAPITFSYPGNTITTGWCQVRYLPRGGRIGSIHFSSINPAGGAAVTGSASITFEVSADTGVPSYTLIGTSGITSASQAKDTTLSGFTATIPANRILRACVASATSVQHLVVSPEVW